MNNLEKLRVMLPHWIEHNQGHAAEFSLWTEKLKADSPEVTALLRDAVNSLQKAETSLAEALNRAGGPLAPPGHHDEHLHSDNPHGHCHRHRS